LAPLGRAGAHPITYRSPRLSRASEAHRQLRHHRQNPNAAVSNGGVQIGRHVNFIRIGILAAAVGSGVALQPDLRASELAVGDGGRSPFIADDAVIAASGRVEPASEEILIGAPINGLVKQVLVKAGDHVVADEVVALLELDQPRAQLAAAQAELRCREDELRRLLSGARPEERAIAQTALEEADAEWRTASSALERRRPLLKQGSVPQDAFERTEEISIVTHARREAASQHLKLITGPPREEDVAFARAQIELAQAKRDQAQAHLNEGIIRSPIEGTVLHVSRHTGEIVSVFTDPTIMMVGDVSHLRVRAAVKERDIGGLQLGMPAYVTAEAFGGQHFTGHLLAKAKMLGGSNGRTKSAGERAAHAEANTLEVVIDLDNPGELLPGQNVNAFIMAPKTASN
jgi:multidrug resistance efflux pump